MPDLPNTTAEEEHRFHHYTGNAIPWYVHLLWIIFWISATLYILVFLLPALREELLPPL